MKVATLRRDGTFTTVLIDSNDRALELLSAPGHQPERGLAALLSASNGQLDRPDGTGSFPLDMSTLAAPIPSPERNIFCVGKNYEEHARELASTVFQDTGPQFPIIFSKVPETVISQGEAIQIDPSVSRAIDYEGELGVIIGRAGRNIATGDAMQHVWGYTIINDVTARDIQKRHNQWLLGKSQDTFCPMGPWAVSADRIDLSDTPIRTYVNGELRQNGNTRDMIFGVPELIATISNGLTLQPGDIIATGTPAGVGMGFDPPRFLQHGDVIRVEIDGIGALENPVIERGREPGA